MGGDLPDVLVMTRTFATRPTTCNAWARRRQLKRAKHLYADEAASLPVLTMRRDYPATVSVSMADEVQKVSMGPM